MQNLDTMSKDELIKTCVDYMLDDFSNSHHREIVEIINRLIEISPVDQRSSIENEVIESLQRRYDTSSFKVENSNASDTLLGVISVWLAG